MQTDPGPGPGPGLDAELAALQRAVAARDEEAVQARLLAIERALQSMSPLLRGLSYAHVQSVLGRPERAVAVLDDLLELIPDDPVIFTQLGYYRRAARDHDGALAAFTRATELDATRADAWLERGTLLDARGEPERAIEAYRHAILRAPTEVAVWRNLGNSLAALARYDQAHEAYRTALGLAPADDTLAFLIASTHQAKGELELANARLPATLREQLGEVVEVRLGDEGIDLRCRFHGPRARIDVLRSAASALLRALAAELRALAAELPREPEQPPPLETPSSWRDGFVVRQQQWLVLCDRDAIGPGPHRFLDASEIVAGQASRAT